MYLEVKRSLKLFNSSIPKEKGAKVYDLYMIRKIWEGFYSV